MRGDEAVRKMQYLLSSWNIDLTRHDRIDAEKMFFRWVEEFAKFCEENEKRSVREMQQELIDDMLAQSGYVNGDDSDPKAK